MTKTTTEISGTETTTGQLTTYHVTYLITRASIYEIEAESAATVEEDNFALCEGRCIDEGDITDHQHFETVEAEPSPPDSTSFLIDAAPDLLAALEQALEALNTAPRFKVPGLDSDSYRIAAICDRAITAANGGAS